MYNSHLKRCRFGRESLFSYIVFYILHVPIPRYTADESYSYIVKVQGETPIVPVHCLFSLDRMDWKG